MSWIRTVPYEEASGRLKTLYDRVKGPDDKVRMDWLRKQFAKLDIQLVIRATD